jgi:prepilin peptidase CpaA
MTTPVAIWSTVALVVVACVACVTDIRQRRIPNQLTFPAIAFGLVSHLATGGWGGVLFAATGALLAPALLSLLHGAKGPGAGDLKMAAVLGANLGPLLGGLSILLSAVAGGLLAGLWALGLWLEDFWPPARRLFSRGHGAPPLTGEAGAGRSIAQTIIPYGLALSAGALLTLVYYWSTGGRKWLM